MKCPIRGSLGFLLFLVCSSHPVQAADKPNILFLFADDQRADTIAAHGNPHIKTPSLDRLAAAGFSFRSNYCFGGNSGAVCVPSRAMLMSGKTWFNVDTASLKGAKLLPELLQEHGYVTFATGKWHNGQPSWLRAFQRGRNVFFGGMSDHAKVPLRDLGPDGKLTEVRTGEKLSSELFADAAIEFLSSHDGKKPFFVYVAFTAPHDPRMPPLPYREPYYRNLPPLPANFLPQLLFDNGMMRGGRDENLAAWPRTEAVIRDQLAEYYGLITHMDEQVGRILAALRQTGQADNTLIVYAADNGLALGSHGLLGKQSVFEHSMRVPLIVAGPGIPQGKSTQAFSYLLDIFPTLCDTIGIQRPADLEGESLRPLWEGKKDRVRDSVFLPFIQIQRAVRDQRWKLICYPRIGHMQLFDLQTDPDEKTNLIDRPDSAEHVQRLLKLMKRWQAKVGDRLELPTGNKPPEKVDLTGRKRDPDPWQPEWIRKKYFDAPQEHSPAPPAAHRAAGAPKAASTPNIIVILADDLGYGDVQCYNPQRGKIPTPNMDRLAAEGMRFTDGHSSSGVCSPSRYALLTGRYHWRTRLQAGIVGVFGDPLIAPDRLTIAGLAKQHGYGTACIGKWHLGRDWGIPQDKLALFHIGKGSPAVTDEHRAAWQEVFSKPIAGGPTARGFDEYFGTDVPNWPPYCFIENDRTVGIPSEFLPAALLKDNQASLQGPALADWKLEAILPALGDRACDFIAREAKAKQPFLLYMPLTSPHTPLAVNGAWKGRSGLGLAYPDFVMETDAVVGRVLDALEQSGIAGNTLVFFTSDNGCAPYIGAKAMEAQGHFPSGPLRGYKGDVWEGGHRVPFVVRWPGVVRPGSVCRQLVHQADIMATLAGVLRAKLPQSAGEDSFSLVPLLNGEDRPIREHAVSCASRGVAGLRRGPWKLIFERDPQAKTDVQLYNLDDDIGETKNLAADKPELVAGMKALMERLIANGRSTPGASQKNDVEVGIHTRGILSPGKKATRAKTKRLPDR